MKSRLVALVLLSCSFTWMGCPARSRVRFPSFDSPVQPKPYAVGVVLPLSGEYEALGQEVLKGIQLAARGSPLKLSVRDSQGNPVLAAQAVEELANEEKVVAIVGTVLQEEARQAGTQADRLGVPFITFAKGEGVPEVGAYVFRDMLTLKSQAEAMAAYAVESLALQRFAIIQPETAYGKELATAFADALSAKGGKLETVLTYPPEQASFVAEAQKLTERADLAAREDYQEAVKEIQKKEIDPFRRRKAIEKARAQVKPIVSFEALFVADDWRKLGLIAPALAAQDVVTNACEGDELERAKKTLGREDVPTVTLLGWSGWSSPRAPDGTAELLRRGGKYVRCGVYLDGFFSESERPGTREFVRQFREAHAGLEPNLLSASGYEAALLVRRLLQKEPSANRGRFRELLAAPPGKWEGAAGLLGFHPDGEADKSLFFLQISRGGIVELTRPPALAPLRSR